MNLAFEVAEVKLSEGIIVRVEHDLSEDVIELYY
jgi:hypothetical protein